MKKGKLDLEKEKIFNLIILDKAMIENVKMTKGKEKEFYLIMIGIINKVKTKKSGKIIKIEKGFKQILQTEKLTEDKEFKLYMNNGDIKITGNKWF